MDKDRWHETLARTHRVVLEFARVEFASLASKAVWHLQQIEATDIFADDYHFETLWDEYCYYVQTGPYDLLDDAIGTTTDDIIAEIIGKVPHHAAKLLSVGALDDSDDYDDPALIGTIATTDLNRSIKSALDSIAASRSLDHFLDSE